jgi:hypothetical protein
MAIEIVQLNLKLCFAAIFVCLGPFFLRYLIITVLYLNVFLSYGCLYPELGKGDLQNIFSGNVWQLNFIARLPLR